MKQLVLLGTLCACGSHPPPVAPSAPPPASPASSSVEAAAAPVPEVAEASGSEQFLAALKAGDFVRAESACQGPFRAILPAPALKEMWSGITAAAGTLQGWTLVRSFSHDEREFRIYDLTFERAVFRAKMADHTDTHKLLAFTLSAAEPNVSYDAPANAPFTAEQVTIARTGFTLAGTLLLPKSAQGPVPAVLLQSGSGQQTRDEPVPVPGLEDFRPFRQVAEALAARGMAVLRVDDRGAGASTGDETLPGSMAEFADDARAEVAFLRAHKDIDPERIAIVGHSAGSYYATMVAGTDPRLAAVVLMAGPGKLASEILEYQLGRVIAQNTALSPDERASELAKVRAQLVAATDGRDDAAGPFAGSWFRSFLNEDPLETMRHVKQPALIMQGGLDQQITVDQGRALLQAARSAGNRKLTLREFPQLNHLFLPAKTGEESEYATLTVHQLPDEVVKAISDWLAKQLHVAR